MNLLHLRNIGRITHIVEPFEHVSKVLHHIQYTSHHEAERSRNFLTSLLLEDLCPLLKRQLITSQRNRTTLVILRIQEDFRRDRADIIDPDHLQRLPLQRDLEGRRKDLAHKVWGEIFVESSRAKNRPIHLTVFCLFDQVFLDVILFDEMGDVGWIFEGLFAVAIDRGIDEVLDAVFQSFVD